MLKVRFLFVILSLSAVPAIFPVPSSQEMLCPMGMPMSVMAAAQQDPPQTTPPEVDPDGPNGDNPPAHKEPTEFCTPYNRPDGKMPCMCTMDAIGMAGCKEGKRETEVQHCNSYCWKAFCRCCRS